MLMRVSIGIHKQDLEAAFRTYHLMSMVTGVPCAGADLLTGSTLCRNSSRMRLPPCSTLARRARSAHRAFCWP